MTYNYCLLYRNWNPRYIWLPTSKFLYIFPSTLTFLSTFGYFFIFAIFENCSFICSINWTTELMSLWFIDYRLNVIAMYYFCFTKFFITFFSQVFSLINPPKTEKTKKLIKIPIVLQLGTAYNLFCCQHELYIILPSIFCFLSWKFQL